MRLHEAGADLRRLLEEAQLNPERLDPWLAWKVFKASLHHEVEDVYDAASFQGGMLREDEDPPASYGYFVRQFSDWEPGEQWDEDTDEPISRVVVEFRYPADARLGSAVEIWTHDYKTLEEFASVVEAQPQFQAMVSLTPLDTSVYSEEI